MFGAEPAAGFSFQLYDLGNVVNTMGMCLTEFDRLGEEDMADYRNEYTEVSVAITKLLKDDSLVHSGYTSAATKASEWGAIRGEDGSLVISEDTSLFPSGISIFMDLQDGNMRGLFFDKYDDAIGEVGDNVDDGMVDIPKIKNSNIQKYLSEYRDTVALYSLIYNCGTLKTADREKYTDHLGKLYNHAEKAKKRLSGVSTTESF